MKQKVDNKTTWTGFSFDIINELACRMNFRYILLSDIFLPVLQSVFLLIKSISLVTRLLKLLMDSLVQKLKVEVGTGQG